ncbi:MAG: HEAT repeat domain-containing protein [Myxococcota bacterium]
MVRRARIIALSLCIFGVVGGGCQSLIDAFNAGENERKSNEANRARFHQQQLEARQRKMEPVLRKVKKPPKEQIVKLDPESPEGILFAELTARMACRDDKCRSEALQRIRRHADTLLPALPKLLTGQSPKVAVEALRLAGLFKVKSAIEGVSRALLLGDTKVREEAVWTLGAIGSPGGIEALRRFAALDHAPAMMAKICRSLGQIGTAGAMAPIETVFMQGTAETRIECLDAASRVGGGKARPLFERAMADPRPAVSQAANKWMKAAAATASEVTKPERMEPPVDAPK